MYVTILIGIYLQCCKSSIHSEISDVIAAMRNLGPRSVNFMRYVSYTSQSMSKFIFITGSLFNHRPANVYGSNYWSLERYSLSLRIHVCSQTKDHTIWPRNLHFLIYKDLRLGSVIAICASLHFMTGRFLTWSLVIRTIYDHAYWLLWLGDLRFLNITIVIQA